MYSLRNRAYELVAAILILFILFQLYLKIQPSEGAEGFYIIRPTSWKADPTGITVYFTSFHPSTLLCTVNTDGSTVSIAFEPRTPVMLRIPKQLTPNTMITLPVEINCTGVYEKGYIRMMVFTHP